MFGLLIVLGGSAGRSNLAAPLAGVAGRGAGVCGEHFVCFARGIGQEVHLLLD